MSAWYNENDPGAADWLEQNIALGLVAPGIVDRRSITEVQPDDLLGYDQHHFFAGIGGWSFAARLAGWPDARPLWTGSCPCQPFSVAGKGAGNNDARHLWPDLLRLIAARRPFAVVGEQVAGAAGYGWFDGVRAGLEGEGYAGRAVDIPACAIDAPHQRQRLYWVALDDTMLVGTQQSGGQISAGRHGAYDADAGLANADRGRCDWRQEEPERGSVGRDVVERADARGSVADALCKGWDAASHAGVCSRQEGTGARDEHPERLHGRNGSWWAGADWIVCHDSKARRVADASAPLLVDGFPNRVLAWRGIGNAIVPPLAAEVIGALMDTLEAA